jgi:S-adenosylmethionine/arginine decarboxylase-like enzyme
VHTWPESGHAAFDIYAGPGANADAMIAVLKAAFSAGSVVVKARERAVQPAAAAWRPEVVQKKAPARVRKARAA